jgi:hypothetical protein
LHKMLRNFHKKGNLLAAMFYKHTS